MAEAHELTGQYDRLISRLSLNFICLVCGSRLLVLDHVPADVSHASVAIEMTVGWHHVRRDAHDDLAIERKHRSEVEVGAECAIAVFLGVLRL